MSSPSESNRLQVDLELVKKYNVPGPRYTSYPPATRFTEEASREVLLDKITENNRSQRPLSLYFHLPFCRSLCWFCGCTTVITTQQEMSSGYLGTLDKELAWMARHINPDRKAVQLHFGGGTPTFLRPDEIRALGRMIRERFTMAPEVEAGVEIDPRWLTEDHIEALREAGFNRASLGVQDHNPEVQKAVHRIQPYEQTKAAIDWIRAAGFKSLNVDLIYGLPLQTPESFDRTLDEVLTLAPDRFAVFNYAHVPWIKPAQKTLKEEKRPNAEIKLQMLKLIIEKLTSSGYDYIGMDHFARNEDELTIAQRNKTLQRNFQGYSTCGEADIYGFGMSSISQGPDTYWQNLKDLPAYTAAVNAGEWPLAKGYVLTEDDKVRRHTIMRLMCDLSLDYKELSESLNLDFESYFKPELESFTDMESDGLVQRRSGGLEVTEVGRLLIRNIAMRFDAYVGKEAEQRYSKTI
jgi:oxygen-independent coproporphyrinogen III oxidase